MSFKDYLKQSMEEVAKPEKIRVQNKKGDKGTLIALSGDAMKGFIKWDNKPKEQLVKLSTVRSIKEGELEKFKAHISEAKLNPKNTPQVTKWRKQLDKINSYIRFWGENAEPRRGYTEKDKQLKGYIDAIKKIAKEL